MRARGCALVYSAEVQQPARAGANFGVLRRILTVRLIRRDASVAALTPVADTEEVTGSNPVRPTRHFLFLALPGSAPWPYNWP